MQFADRMNSFGVSIFSVLLEMKKEKEARGERVIDLSVGTPNIPPAEHIISALVESARDGKNYVYSIGDLPRLRRAVADWYARRYHVNVDPEKEVVALLGSQEGLAHFALTLVNPGDVVLVQNPCYPVFADGPRIAGAEIYDMPLRKEKNYLIDFSEIPEEVARRAKLMVVSYPNNPTTAIAPPEFYERLIAFAKKYDIVVLHDNAYSELVFDLPEEWQTENGGKSFLEYPGARDVGVEFNSLSKTYGLAGARVGFCVGNAQIVEKLAKLKSNMDYGMFIPVQEAAIAALSGPQDCVLSTRNAYRARRDCLCSAFENVGWHIDPSPATMFVWAKIPEGFSSSVEFVKTLLDRAGVMVTPGDAFGRLGEGYVRIALVQDEEDILAAARQMEESGIFA